MKVRRLVSFAPMTMEVEEADIPDRPGPGQLLVETQTTAVSAGTEVANYRGITVQRAGSTDWRENPYRPGYSLAGTVRAVGDGISAVKVGDVVCGQGPHASAAIVDVAGFVAVPEGVTADQASMTTLCAIVMNGVRLAKLQLGQSVAVVGAGLVGQLTCRFARLSGARPVVSVDPIAARRELALDCGADEAVEPAHVGREFDVVFEATGSPAAFNPALQLVRRLGRIVALGSTRGVVDGFDLYGDLHLRGITLIGAHFSTSPQLENPHNPWTPSRNRELALRLIADEELRLDRLISHRVAASDGPAMFHKLATSREDFLGVLLKWDG